MPPWAPRVATVAKTQATTTRVRTPCIGHATQVARRPSPYGSPGSQATSAAVLGSSNRAAPERLGHAVHDCVEGMCCLNL